MISWRTGPSYRSVLGRLTLQFWLVDLLSDGGGGDGGGGRRKARDRRLAAEVQLRTCDLQTLLLAPGHRRAGDGGCVLVVTDSR